MIKKLSIYYMSTTTKNVRLFLREVKLGYRFFYLIYI